MKNLNKKVIFLSFAITALILFGGWFGIQFLGTEKPITDYLNKQESIEVIDLVVDQRKVDIVIQFDAEKDFAKDYVELRQFLTESAKGKEINLQIDPNQSENHPWWLDHSSVILESLYDQKYTKIEETIHFWIESGTLSEGKLSMNSNKVFIYLKPLDQEGIYLIFPVPVEKGGTP